MPRPWERGRDSRRARSAGSSRCSPPSNQIPLDVLHRSFVQNSSAESSNLSSSHSPSTTPPSSAEQLPAQESWPSLANGNQDSSAPTSSQLLQPSTTEARAEGAAPHSDPQSVSLVDDGNQATPVSHEQHPGSPADAQESAWLRLGRWVSKRGWFQSILGTASLLVAVVSLCVYGLRSYEMAKWSERNDFLQMCAGLIQANHTEGPDCERVLAEGPTLPPYSKRAMMYTPGVDAYKLTKRVTTSMQHLFHRDWAAHKVTDYGFGRVGNWTLATLSALVMAGGVLALLRSRSSEEVVFTSAAKSDGGVKVTRHYAGGPETTQTEGPVQITRLHPPEDQSPGALRRRIIQDRYRQEEGILCNEGGFPYEPSLNNRSEDTLVADWTESNSREVSIATGPDEGLHEGLIELKPTKNTKNFLDPNTGVSYHMSPWKSTHDGDEDGKLSLHFKSKPEGTVKHAILGMSVGGAALANGKTLEDKIAQVLEKKVHVPQRAGDCLAGEVTNEAPTGKSTLA